MAFDFPSSPIENQTFTPPGGPTYTYKAPRWIATSLAAGSVPEAPNDSNAYVRSAMAWVVGYTKSAIDALLNGKVSEAPNDSNVYVRGTLAWVVGYSKAAIDTLLGNKVNKAGDTMTGNLTIQPASGVTAVANINGSGTNAHAQEFIQATGTGGHAQFFMTSAFESILQRLDKAAGKLNYVEPRTAGVTKWQIYWGDAADDVVFKRMPGGTDALKINQATGVATLEKTPVGPAADPVGANDLVRKAYVDSATKYAETYNMVVNPAMQINQELGVGVSTTANGAYPLDQWQLSFAGGGTLQGTQIDFGSLTTGGSRYAARLLCSVVDASIAATDLYGLNQKIEGLTMAQLAWGTAAAKQAILRFEANSSVSGTYYAAIRNGAADRSIVFPITLAANTWTTFEFVVPGITTGVWPSDATLGAYLSFYVATGTNFYAPATGVWQTGNFVAAAGGTNFMAAVNNVFYVNNVGLYRDFNYNGKAPPFVLPDYGTELARCQRYYVNDVFLTYSGDSTTGVNYFAISSLPVSMRAVPAMTGVNSSATGFPTAVGTMAGLTVNTIREYRTCNATAAGRNFSTNATASARL
jgi:hypothetical protein